MKKSKIAALGLSGILALSACTGTDVTNTTDAGGVTSSTSGTTQDDSSSAILELQAEVTDLQTAVQNSAASAELQESWNALQTEVLAVISSASADGVVDTTELQDEIDAFQSDLDALGSDVEDDVRSAWDKVKDRIESMMS